MSGEYAVLVCGLVVVFRTLLRTTQAARTLERLRKAYVICCIMACLFRTVHLFSQPLIYGCNWPEQNFAWYIPGSSLIFTFVLGWFLLVLHVFASRGTPRCQLAGTAALAVLGCVWLSPLLFLPLKTVYSLGGSMAILTVRLRVLCLSVCIVLPISCAVFCFRRLGSPAWVWRYCVRGGSPRTRSPPPCRWTRLCWTVARPPPRVWSA